MAPVTTPPLPGSMTVPPLFGWSDIITVLVLLVAVAVAFLLIRAARADVHERSEWEAWLDARSGRRGVPDTDRHDRCAELVRTERDR